MHRYEFHLQGLMALRRGWEDQYVDSFLPDLGLDSFFPIYSTYLLFALHSG